MMSAALLKLPETGGPLVEPLDEQNRILVANAHPPEWVNPEPAGRYNLVVIGAGTAGLVTAAGAAGLGAKVALVEKGLMGGDCLNVGCVPSKAMIRAARAAAEVRGAAEFGVLVPPGVRVDFGRVMERVRRLRAGISPNDSAARFRSLGVDVFLGNAEFASGGSAVRVGDALLNFKKAVIATGGRAARLPVPGLQDAGYLTNESVFNLTELPERLAVVGAGPIGCELAQAFARFGSKVFLIEALHGVLPREDPAAAEIVRGALLRDGIRVLCCGKELVVSRTAEGKRLVVDSHDQHYELLVDEILVAGGRKPNVENLNLDGAGVEFDAQGVRVNERLQTSNPRIYAAGDVCSRYQFTHAADAMARIVIQNALFAGRAKVSALTMPWCTYTSPEVAHVGLYEGEARERGLPVRTFVQELREVDRAVLDGEAEGFVKVHVKRGTDRIVGATVVSTHAGDLISEISVAMCNGVGLKGIGRTIHPYPTQAEAVRKLGDQFNRTRLTPLVKSLFAKWLTWTRSVSLSPLPASNRDNCDQTDARSPCK
jgi:pyruvate/2-oxoglutarate dehydrogenase complex dihydrolipoamide dehydrogenase (E3) component